MLIDEIGQSVQKLPQQRETMTYSFRSQTEEAGIPTSTDDMLLRYDDTIARDANSTAGSTSYRFNQLPGALPLTAISPDTDHADIARRTVRRLGPQDPGFAADAIWRDIFALTGNLRTFYGSKGVLSTWRNVVSRHQSGCFGLTTCSSKVVQIGPDHAWISARFTFRNSRTPKSLCSGEMGLVPLGAEWRIWYLTTMLEELSGYPNPDYMTACGINSVTTPSSGGVDYECVVVGAGFAGLCLAGRLKAMGIHHLVVDRHKEIGASWKERYDSLRLHTTKYYSDFPFGPVLRDQAEYFPKSSELVEGYRENVRRHELNVQLSSALVRTDFDDESRSEHYI